MSARRLRCIRPPDSHGGMGNFIAWDAAKGEIVWSKPELFSVWSGALATDGDVVFYGTLEGYIKAVDKDGNELYKFKTPSGIIGNINTYEHGGKQYIAVLSGVGGWAGIGLAGGLLSPENAAAWHGAVDQGRAAGRRSHCCRHRRSGRRRRLRRLLPTTRRWAVSSPSSVSRIDLREPRHANALQGRWHEKREPGLRNDLDRALDFAHPCTPHRDSQAVSVAK